MLSHTTKESVILFDDRFYKQLDGVAMGSSLGPTLANAFLCYHENKWLNDCPLFFKQVYYRRYVDDIFVCFNQLNHVSEFVNYMNKKHKNTSFSFEIEKSGQLFFLDINIVCENDQFVKSA